MLSSLTEADNERGNPESRKSRPRRTQTRTLAFGRPVCICKKEVGILRRYHEFDFFEHFDGNEIVRSG